MPASSCRPSLTDFGFEGQISYLAGVRGAGSAHVHLEARSHTLLRLLFLFYMSC